MSVGGWIFLILIWGIITSIMVFCYGRVLKDNGSSNNDD
jgi:hypothetical protein